MDAMSGLGTIDRFIDPALLPLVAEQNEANDALRAAAVGAPAIGSVEPALLRRRRLYNRDGGFRPPLLDIARDEFVAIGSGAILVRSIPATSGDGLIVHFHGGGWSLGSVYEQDWLLGRLAARSGAEVCSVDYPLAPEFQLPQAIEVATAALAAMMEAAPDRPVAIIGESAGAHVALSSVMATPRLQRTRIRAMCLNYGIYDLGMTGSQRTWGSEFLGLSTPWLEHFYSLTLPGLSREQRGSGRYSPLNADVTGLPPTLFNVGQLDPLLDDSVLMFERWRDAGNDGELRVYPAAPHGFNHLATRMAEACNHHCATFLTARLGDRGR